MHKDFWTMMILGQEISLISGHRASGYLGNDDFRLGNLRDFWSPFTRISGQ
jgi:hypothetical protein